MIHLTLPRAALAASLGLLLALPVAATAFAGGGKPSAPPAKPAKPAAGATEKFASFADLEASADKAEEASHQEMRRKRYEMVVAYLAANGKAADAEAARVAAFELAAEVEEWAKAVQHADEYLAAHAEGKNVADAKLTRAQGLGKQGKKAEAVAAYDALIAAMDGSKADMAVVQGNLGIFSTYAEYLVDADDTAAAKAVWQKLKDLYAAAEFSGQVAQFAENQMKPLEMIGQPAIAIPESAKDLDGKAVTLADYKGKVLLIDFWATWCGPCRAEMPNVIAAYKKFHDKGFEILGVTLDRPNDVQKVKDFIKEKGMPWRQVHYAGENEVATAYGVESIPHTVLVDREGKVLRVGLRGEALGKKLADLLK